MPNTVFYSPINENAVDYALSITRNYLGQLKQRAVGLERASVLEIGPGAEFAAALVMASHGATVTLADRFLAPWDDNFHPGFYRVFLERWDGPRAALETVVAQGSYDNVLRLLPMSAESLAPIADGSTDLVLSNAVLEHVQDLPRVVREMARISRPGGVQAHQVDCRDHRNFSRPLDHLLVAEAEFEAERNLNGCIHGTQMRLQEIAECFAPYFWIDEMEPNCFAEVGYLDELAPRLKGRFAKFPRQSLRVTGGRLWLSRKSSEATIRNSHIPAVKSRWRQLLRRLSEPRR